MHGIVRKTSSFNTAKNEHFSADCGAHRAGAMHLHYGDLSDSSSLFKIINKVQPDEIYNLGAQSHVGASFPLPVYTADVNGLGTLRIVDAIRICGLEKTVRVFQASTSELFGKAQETSQNEDTPFYPCSPYGNHDLALQLTKVMSIQLVFFHV